MIHSIDDSLSTSSYSQAFARQIALTFRDPTKMDPEEWAENVYRLPGGGRFRFSYCPYTRKMFRSLFDPFAIETCFQVFSRGFKSTLFLLLLGYKIDEDPCRILALWPTNSNAENWRKDNVNGELFDCVPSLNKYSSDSNSREQSNTLLHVGFTGGSLTAFGANAPGDMRRAKGKVLLADEIDAIKKSETDEGDQLAIFWKRGDEYPDTIRATASYPGLMGHSRIQAKLDASDYNEWHSTCVRCGGEPYVMHRKMTVYEPGRKDTARMECPRCHEFLTDDERYSMAHEQGEDCWIPRNDFTGKRGFHANGMLWPHEVDRRKYPSGYLGMIAEQEMQAEDAPDPRRARRIIVNTIDAEPFDPVAETEAPPEWKLLFKQREDYGLILPMPTLFLSAYADVQDNRIEVAWQAWAEDEESWMMEHVVIDGSVKDAATWNKLKLELLRVWVHANGAKMRLSFGMIDGGAYGEHVMRFLRRLKAENVTKLLGRVRASKGFGIHGMTIVSSRFASINKNAGLKGHHIGTWAAKDLIYHWLRQAAIKVHFNLTFGEEWFKQATIEKVTIEWDGGQEIKKYLNANGARNEALDIMVGNLACVRLRQRGPSSWAMLKMEMAELRAAAEAEKAGTKRVIAAKAQPTRRRMSVMDGLSAGM